MNKEILEKVAEDYYEQNAHCVTFLMMAEFGAKWQQQNSYSEEEVRKLLMVQRGNSYVAILSKTRDEELASIANLAPEPSGKDGWVKKS